MVLSPAEKQRSYRERQKELRDKANEDARAVFKMPFFKWLQNNEVIMDDFSSNLDFAGIDPPEFNDDRGPASFNGSHEQSEACGGEEGRVLGKGNSLARAEVMVEALAAAAAGLASDINAYKVEQLKNRLTEIEASDLSNAETKKAALKEVTRLNKMLDQLNKQVRWPFHQWKVTG